jgi:hypothetical protein
MNYNKRINWLAVLIVFGMTLIPPLSLIALAIMILSPEGFFYLKEEKREEKNGNVFIPETRREERKEEEKVVAAGGTLKSKE